MDAPPVQYFTTSDGYDLAYVVAGHGPVLVYLPGAFSHAQLYWTEPTLLQKWWRGLASHFHFVQYDGRGLGLSTRGLRPETTAADFTRDLWELAAHLKLDRFVAMGEGYAGHVAARFAAAHPERVAGLVLIDTPVANSAWPQTLFSALASENWDAFIMSLVSSGVSPSNIELAMERMKLCITQGDWAIRARVLAGSDLSDVLRQIEAPTLILHPRDYKVLPLAESQKLAARMKNARLTLIDGQGAFGDPEQGLAAIERFVAGLPAATSRLPPRPEDGLSQREIEVLRLLAAGKSNPQIAGELVISVHTVGRHVSNIFAKIGAANRAEAAAYATRQGIA